MSFINYNGKIIKQDSFTLSPSNRSFRYADGFFETMRLCKGKVVLQDLHLARLYSSLEILKLSAASFPASPSIITEIVELAQSNNCLNSSRIRLTIYSGDGALHDISARKTNYIIQAARLENAGYSFNRKGLHIGLFKDAVKTCDVFSPLKSNSFLPYVMASVDANEKGVDDCILFNPYGKVADASIANIFIVKDGYIKTPPLSDGPVKGVMRGHLLKSIQKEGLPFAEVSVTEEDILQASEVFLTNAIQGIRWVERIGESHYTNRLSSYLFSKLIEPLTA